MASAHPPCPVSLVDYWTGYFTSRPAFKRQVRRASNFLTAARQIEVMSGITADEVTRPFLFFPSLATQS